MLQEGQHSIQHSQSNNRLAMQGIEVNAIEAYSHKIIERQRLRMPRSFAIALTAAYEHLTTIIANAVTEHGQYFADTDRRIFALYAWHCAEELEHKSVCFDVMQQVAKVAYFERVIALILGTIFFQFQIGRMINRLLKTDGYTFPERFKLWSQGLKWMYVSKGFFTLQLGHYYAYFRPNFHPSLFGKMEGYEHWAEVFRRTNDPLAAGDAIRLPESHNPQLQAISEATS